ncbi:class I SAM-dependent methyltransferase [Nostoc sp. CENA67]|uniref:Class I SAM-dependent methyltransferase n=1 Tax=Amazonocrinis nigriterrae CENA67 TaxID=2794033 RepID=A0A8J7HUQ2_9NOST|nr:class I SAM-dependent methyltransferase [Amazonocrinis nigriterrae]MBH8563943.1 class I SAM-dependent methyltransferase [Amazonocrinis nigriterrae CENA67]
MSNAPLRKELHEENRLSWNEATKAHNSHKGDQGEFFREGGNTLFPEEKELLGNISGLSVVHLQCNAGQDTLSLARLGAAVTGIDISDEAIAFAQKLSDKSGINATFHRADIFDWLEEAANQNQKFDIVFSSYGAVLWLSNLSVWAKGIAAILKSGGRFVLVEFHPVAMMFDWDWSHKFSYFNEGKPLTWEDGISDYVAISNEGLILSDYETGIENFSNPYRSHEFQWGIGEVVTALLQAGLRLEVLQEYPYLNGCKGFERMRADSQRRWFPPEDVPNLPLMYGIVARKP